MDLLTTRLHICMSLVYPQSQSFNRESLQFPKATIIPTMFIIDSIFLLLLFSCPCGSAHQAVLFSSFHPCLGHIGAFSLEKCPLAIAMTSNQESCWSTLRTAKSVGKSFALVQNSWSHGLLLKWLDFASENSLSNGKCDRTFRERLPRGHGFS